MKIHSDERGSNMVRDLEAQTLAKFNSGKITEEKYLTDMIFYEKQKMKELESVIRKKQKVLESTSKAIAKYEARLEELKGTGE